MISEQFVCKFNSSDIEQVLSEVSDVVNESNEENGDSAVATHIKLTDKSKTIWDGPYEMLQMLMVKLARMSRGLHLAAIVKY